MKDYILIQANKGYLLRDSVAGGYVTGEIYAFSTLKELRDFLPGLLEPKQPKIKRPGDQ